MKKWILFVVFFIINTYKTQEVSAELLKAPISPASQLLGISNTEIFKPTDVTNVALGLQNLALGNFKTGGFSMEFAPDWIFWRGTKDKTINNMLTNKNSVPQTFVISLAVNNTDNLSTNLPKNSIYNAIGFKFSILRGNATDETQAKVLLISDNLKKISNIYIDKKNSNSIRYFVENHETYKDLYNKRSLLVKDLSSEEQERIKKNQEYKKVDSLLNKVVVELKSLYQKELENSNEEYKQASENIKLLTKDFEIKRTGWLLDVAGGTSVQFREKQFNNSKIHNAGLWSVFGYAFEKHGTPLLLLRFLYNPNTSWLTTNNFTKTGDFAVFDAGAKYEYNPKDSKFTTGFEGIYRSFMSGADIKPTWKFVWSLDYQVLKNQHITLTLGKDFDNTFIKGGNVIAGLSFISGLGSKRAIQ